MAVGNILSWLVLGALIGWLAARIMGGKRGLIRNIIVGVVGAGLGGWIASALGMQISQTFSFWGMVVSIGGACLLIFLCRIIAGTR